jgi:hypothetical protein
LGNSQLLGRFPKPNDLGNSQSKAAGAYARARHDHDSDDTDHDHESVAARGEGSAPADPPDTIAARMAIPWGNLHQDLLDDIHEVCEPARVTFKQEEEWRRRILAHPRIVREAVLETQDRKKKGDLTKPENPGCFLNRVYLDWSGARKMEWTKTQKS